MTSIRMSSCFTELAQPNPHATQLPLTVRQRRSRSHGDGQPYGAETRPFRARWLTKQSNLPSNIPRIARKR